MPTSETIPAWNYKPEAIEALNALFEAGLRMAQIYMDGVVRMVKPGSPHSVFVTMAGTVVDRHNVLGTNADSESAWD